MPRSRDRHGRGIRGPLALPHSWSRLQKPVPVPLRRPGRTQFFNECVAQAMAEIADFDADVLREVLVSVEEVPTFDVDWSGGRVPMSAGLESDRGRKAKIVIYERPHEHRASTRAQLRDLVHRTIVEQLSTLTGIPIEDLTDRDLEDGWDD